MKNIILLISLIAAFATFTPWVDAATTRTHEINFDMLVQCVQDRVHLQGPFHLSLTFSAEKSLTSVAATVNGIKGAGENTPHKYVADQGNMTISLSPYTVRNGVGKGTITVTFQIIGRVEGNPGNVIRFCATQTVRVVYGKTLNLDFESLKVCLTSCCSCRQID